MTKDKKVLYTISTGSFAVLLLLFFVTARNSVIVTAVAMAIVALLVCLLIKKRSSLSINKGEVLILTTVISALFVILMLIAGTFFESYKNPYFVNVESLLEVIIPSVVVIVTSEIVRYVLLAQKNKFASVISWLIGVMAEILMFSVIKIGSSQLTLASKVKDPLPSECCCTFFIRVQ